MARNGTGGRRLAWRLRGPAAILGLLALAACTQQPESGACTVVGFGDVKMLNRRGSPVIQAEIDGHPVAFTVDTGAFLSTIARDQVEPLGISENGARGFASGVSGEAAVGVGTARTLTLGTGRAKYYPFMIADLPRERTPQGLPMVGLLGTELALNYDIVLDQPGMSVGFLTTRHCSTPTPLWHGPIHEVRVDIGFPQTNKIGVTLTLNGKMVRAALDSGAQTTVIPLDDARRAGVTQAMLDADRSFVARGLGNRPITGWRHRFATLSVGDIAFHDAMVTILPDQDYALLGADFLRAHRIWIPRRGHLMYVQARKDIPQSDLAQTAPNP